MHLQLETGLVSGLSALAENIQHQSKKLYKPYQVSNLQENVTGCMSPLPAEIGKSSGPIFNNIDAYSIQSDTYRTLETN